jgi:AraC-like DNA-binding protein
MDSEAPQELTGHMAPQTLCEKRNEAPAEPRSNEGTQMVCSYSLEHEDKIPRMVEHIVNRAPYAAGSPDSDETLICNFDSPGIKGSFKDLSIVPGMNLTILDIRTSIPFAFTMETSVPSMFELGFTLKGHVGYAMSGMRQEMDNFAGQGHLCTCRGDMECRISMPAMDHLFMMEVQLNMDLFHKYCGCMDFGLPSFLDFPVGEKSQFVRKCSTLTPQSLRPLVLEMAREGMGSPQGSLKMEEICLDLTSRMIERMSGNLGKGKTVLSSIDLEKIREARYILEQKLTDPPGLVELARLVNLNDFKLKRGFRQAYGSTVHQTLTELRLTEARRLLEEKDVSVSDAAMSVGYGNIGDFGQAFKKRFGVLPSRLTGKLKSVS